MKFCRSYIVIQRTCIAAVLICSLCLFPHYSSAQDCILKDTILKIDFGNAARPQDFSLNNLRNYHRNTGTCPDDGMFSFVSSTGGCYSDHWHTLPQDHTSGDADGRFMIINSSYDPGIFFNVSLSGLKPNTTYELSLWMLNLCRINNECTSLLPDLTIRLLQPDNSLLAQFRTGPLPQTILPGWKRSYSTFTTPANINVMNLVFSNNSPGGCGNDFALDDITFRECIPVTLPVKEVIAKIPPPTAKPVPKPVVKEKTLQKTNNTPVTTIGGKTITQPVEIKNAPARIPVPDPIRTRENIIAKKIQAAEGELTIQLYDNGTIDGDTVSIYHNNELIISRAGLSENPVTVKIKVSKNAAHHELVMVAENLGSIPPNTSLMIVTSKGKREEVFISSTKQQNAKLVIDLKE